MAVITPNGHIDPNDENPFEGRYNRVKAEARAFNAETERRKAEMNRERDELNEERKQAMMRASEHAGSLGLIYKPRLNSFNRVVIVDDLPSLAGDRPAFTEVDLTTEPPTIPASSEPSDAPIEPEATETVVATEPVAKPTITQNFRTLLTQRPAQPEAPPRPEVPKPQETDKKWHRNASIKSAIAWIASLFVGFFVGFGLLSLTGLPYKRSGDWVNLYGFLLLGVAAIVGMKLLFDAMWHEAGRRKGLKTSEWQYSAICTLVSLAILSVEATLGGTALAYYTKKASFQNEGGLPLSLMVLLAVAVSTANLLFSAFIGYQKGLRSVTHEDIQNRIYELDVKEREATKEELLAQHQRDLEAWEAEVKREES
ncbi:hypothetical protein BH11ARM1_BH11ARM1_13460 [soil metagenome]